MAQDLPLSSIRLIAERFVEWQTPYGRVDPERCPFVTQGKCVSTKFHSPTFMAIGLYRAFEDTGDAPYKAAADRYVSFYLACMRNPPTGGQRQDYPAYPYQYKFVNEEYERKFNLEVLVGKLAGVFAGLAIFISCLGLFGLASYSILM